MSQSRLEKAGDSPGTDGAEPPSSRGKTKAHSQKLRLGRSGSPLPSLRRSRGLSPRSRGDVCGMVESNQCSVSGNQAEQEKGELFHYHRCRWQPAPTGADGD